MRSLYSFFLCFLATACLGSVTESKDFIVGTQQHNAIKRMSDSGFGFPDPLGAKDVLVIFRAGAGYQQVMVLGPVAANAKDYADALDKWIQKQTGKQGDVVWSQENDYAAGATTLLTSSFLARSASSKANFGSLVKTLNDDGYQVFAGLIVPKYCAYPVLSYPKGIDKKLTELYNISSSSDSDTLTVSATLSMFQMVSFWVFVFGVPIVLFSSFLYATRLAKNEAIPLEERRPRYARAVKTPTFVAIGVHMPFAMFFIFSRQIYPMMDVWFGSSTVAVVFPLIMAPVMLAFVALFFLVKTEERLFSKDGKKPENLVVEAPDPLDMPKKTAIFVAIACLVVGFALIFVGTMLLPKTVSWRPFLPGVGMLITMFGPTWIRYVYRKTKAKQSPQPVTDPITAKAFEIARQVNCELLSVKIVEGDPEMQGLDLTVFQGQLSIPRRVINELSDDELTFAMAHSMSQNMTHMMVKTFAMVIPLVLFTTFCMVWLPRLLPSDSIFLTPPFRFATFIVPMVCVFLFTLRSNTSRIYQLHRSGLRVCRNADAARSYESRRLPAFLTRNGMLPMSKRDKRLYESSMRMLEKAIKDEGLG